MWTDEDFDGLGWHHSTVHGILILPIEMSGHVDLALDLDYIMRWNDPEPPGGYYTFDVAPATLTFSLASELESELGISNVSNIPMDIDDIIRGPLIHEDWPPPPTGAWRRWTIQGDIVSLEFEAAGFTQHLRAWPRPTGNAMFMTSEQRGGVSFDRPATPATMPALLSPDELEAARLLPVEPREIPPL